MSDAGTIFIKIFQRTVAVRLLLLANSTVRLEIEKKIYNDVVGLLVNKAQLIIVSLRIKIKTRNSLFEAVKNTKEIMAESGINIQGALSIIIELVVSITTPGYQEARILFPIHLIYV